MPAGVTVHAAVDAAPARGGADDPLAEKLRHCPLAVDGAATASRDTGDGIELTITTSTAAGIAEIRRRAAHLVAFTAGQGPRADHGGGAGGGFMQNCPVVTRATSITATDVAGGSRLLVRAVGTLSVAELRAETRRRHAAFTTP